MIDLLTENASKRLLMRFSRIIWGPSLQRGAMVYSSLILINLLSPDFLLSHIFTVFRNISIFHSLDEDLLRFNEGTQFFGNGKVQIRDRREAIFWVEITETVGNKLDFTIIVTPQDTK